VSSLLRIRDAAKILDVSSARLYALIGQGVVPRGVAVRIGRQLRVDPDALQLWIKDGGQPLAGGWRRESPENNL
jgi:excisionase family DNA binding protein